MGLHIVGPRTTCSLILLPFVFSYFHIEWNAQLLQSRFECLGSLRRLHSQPKLLIQLFGILICGNFHVPIYPCLPSHLILSTESNTGQ